MGPGAVTATADMGPADVRADDACAVVGMACTLPGAADPDEYWSLLVEGRCHIGAVPADRFRGALPPGLRAGLLERIDLFDADFFGITPRQAAAMDPQQRMLLELSWQALENAALNPDDLAGTPAGVFVAACSYDYREDLVARDASDGYATIGTFPAFLANRVSHAYDLRGPSITVDTACAGALTALSLASSAIRSGDCEVALVGAANLLSSGFNNRAFHRAGMLSRRGESRVFDEVADGYVRGEGAGWVVLKALHRAVEDGDPVLAVVRGTAVNHGGRASSLTAPNPVAQTAVVRRALHLAGLDAADLGFLEAHGTGTAIGDFTELAAFRQVLAAEPGGMPDRAGGPGGRLWVGSSKANIGHLEAAAGLAGLIKAVQVLRHGFIPGTPNIERLSSRIDLDGSPLAVADRVVVWPRAAGAPPRRAAVSAFGFGGSNAHAVLEEAPERAEPSTGAARGPVAVPLSATTETALRRLAAGLADLLERDRLDVRQTAWSLQVGRRALEHRLLIVADRRADVVAAARAVADDRVDDRVASLQRPTALAGLPPEHRTALDGWLRGGAADWPALWSGETPRRLALVPYPFERKPFWSGGSRDAAMPDAAVPDAALPDAAVRAAAAPGAAGLAVAGSVLAASAVAGSVAAVAGPRDVAVPASPTAWRSQVPGAAARDLDRYVRAALSLRLAELGLASDGRSHATVAAEFGVVPEHRRLLAAVRELVAGDDGRGSPGQARTLLLADHPDLTGHVELVDRALASYGGVLRGEVSGAAVLFPGGSTSAVSAVYDGPLLEPANRRVAEVVAAEVELITARTGGPARIVEVGAGVGATTAAVLDALERRGLGDVEHSYTDISRHFLQQGRRRFGDRVSPQLLDIEKEPADQGFVAGQHDIVLASNVLHATKDLTETLGNVAGLLRPGGCLLLVELVVPAAFYTVIFGLTDGWWRHVDGGQRLPDGPLLDVDRWATLLAAGGWRLADVAQPAEGPGSAAVLTCRLEPRDTRTPIPGAGTPVPGPGVAVDGVDLLAELTALAAEISGQSAEELDPDVDFPSIGVDSLLTEEFTARLRARFPDAAVSSTVLYEFPSLRLLSDRLAPAVAASAVAGPAVAGPPVTGPPVTGPAVTGPAVVAPAAPTPTPAAAGEMAVGGAVTGGVDLLAELTALAAEISGQSAEELDPDVDFPSIGVDSLLTEEFTARLRARFPDAAVSSTVLYEFPSLRLLSGRLAPAVAAPAVAPTAVAPTAAAWPAVAGAAVAAPVATTPLPPPADTVEDLGRADIAVIGLSGRYPGAPDVDAFWRLLSSGSSPVTEVPADRWDWRTARTVGGSYARWGCFLEDWDRFDPEHFRITPRDAAAMDPQERVFLEVAWEAFESAGYTRRTLSATAGGPRVGVFAGVAATTDLIARRDAVAAGADDPEYAAMAIGRVANRVSHALDLSGPSLSVDTMCSSSLTALHLACQSLRAGEADLALAGGVNLHLHPDRFASLCALGMPSRGPHTRAFGLGGDGFVPGEGAGALVVKRLDRAERDGDTVYAVIRGTGANHGGGRGGYLVPNPRAQAALITETLRRAGVDAGDVDYVEAHGTGTALGDPIEVRALATAFGQRPAGGTAVTSPGHPLRIGSVKSNIGHGEASAGIAGLTKTILQIHHGRFAPTLHAELLNPRLELDGTPLHVQRQQEAWPHRVDGAGGPLPRLAAVSSFGAGGSNVHVVLEEYRGSAVDAEAGPAGPVLVPLSARDPERLRAVAGRLAEALAPGAAAETLLRGRVEPRDVAYTLAVGREIRPHRAAVLAHDTRELAEALRALAQGQAHPAVTTVGTADRAENRARDWVLDGTLPADIGTGRRLALPTTPFARVRCAPPLADVGDGRDRPVALPLADSVRTPGSRTVRTDLSATSRWVAEHVVDGVPLLPGAFHVELVLEALLLAGGTPYGAAVRDLAWPAPAAGLPMRVRAELAEADGAGARAFSVHTGASTDGPPAAQGWIEPAAADAPDRGRPTDEEPSRPGHGVTEDVADEEFYRVLDGAGLSYGRLYRTVRRVQRTDDEIVAELALPDGEDADGRHILHPALLDGAFQTAGFLLVASGRSGGRRLRPMAVERVTVHAPTTGAVRVRTRWVRTAGGTHVVDLRLVAADGGELLTEVAGLRIRLLEPDGAGEPALAGYRPGWADLPPAVAATGTIWTIGAGPAARAAGAVAAPSVAGTDEAVLAELARRDGPPAAVLVDLCEGVDGLGLGTRPTAPDELDGEWEGLRTGTLDGVLRLLRAMARSEAVAGAPVLLVAPMAGAGSPVLRALAGAVRVIAGETARLQPRLAGVDADWLRSDPRGAGLAAVTEALSPVKVRATGGELVRLGPDGRRSQAVLTPDPGEPDQTGLSGLTDPDGAYLVVGGLGGLGRAIAASLLAAPAAHVLLVGRSAPDEAALAELRAGSLGATLTYHRADVTDVASLTALAAEIADRGIRLRGIVHTAGVVRDGFLRAAALDHVDAVCRPKIHGALALDAVFAEHSLDFFVVTSSLAALIGNRGQVVYAFANGFLDGFAAARARWVADGLRSGRTLSVSLPVLADAGMTVPPADLAHLTDGYGLAPVPVRTVVGELWRWVADATGPDRAHVAIVAGDQALWSRSMDVRSAASPVTDPPAAEPAPAATGAGALQAAVDGWLAELVGRAIGTPASQIDLEAAFADQGVDSLALMRLNQLMEPDIGRLPLSLLLDTDTLRELSEYLATEHAERLAPVVLGAGAAAIPEPGTPEASPPDGSRSGPVALPERLVGIWAADAAAAPHAPYNVSLCWQLPAGIDLEALELAVDDLVRRHPVLDCCVRQHRGEPALVPAGSGPVILERRPADPADVDAAVRAEADRRFALATQPPLRAVVWEAGDRTLLQLTSHHVVLDARSFELVRRDLPALYLARIGSGGALLPALPPAPPFDAALRREQDGSRRTRGADQEFWAARIGTWTAGGVDREATLFDRPDDAGAAGANREYRLPAELSRLLAGIGRGSGVTPFVAVLGALAVALGRRTGRRSITFAVPVYGRDSDAEEATLGCFVNSVPVRVDLDPAMPVAEWLTGLHHQVRGAVAHAGLPYPRLVELCRDAGGEAAVPAVILAYQNWRHDGVAVPALGPVVFQRADRGHFDLGLQITDGDGGIEILANHRTAVLDGSDVDRVVDDTRGGAVELARVQAAGGTLGTLLDPTSGTVIGRVADSVRRDPDGTAVEDRTGSLSYAQLDALSDRVAQRVAAAAAPGEPVAVLMHRSAALVAVLLGVLKSGRPYVPLDEAYPAERLGLIVAGAGCSVAVVDPQLVGLLPAGPQVLTTDEFDADAGLTPSRDGRPAEVRPDDLAYVMFTSGSTGRPKGVAVTHGNVVHTLDAAAAAIDLRAGHRLLTVSGLCFDLSVLEMFMPLFVGATVVVADRSTVVDAARWAELIDTRGIDVMQATPAGWQHLLDGGWSGSARLTAVCGGEALPAGLAAELAERTAGLWNIYGPTEATIWSTMARLDGRGPVHLGDPVGATDLVVTAVGARRPPADGEPGELWIGGPGVSAGYRNRPDLTAERFTGHPTNPEGGWRWFRVGDLVRRDEQGRLIFLGRADSQVKVRGYRVELGEIEYVLDRHPGLSRTVVTLRGSGASAALVAVVLPVRGRAAPDLDELRAFAERSLPPWMLPDRLVLVESLPLTPNGKVDRAAVGELAEAAGRRRSAPVAATGSAFTVRADTVRDALTACWSDVLDLDEIPGDRSFFELGGNSLLLGRLLARLTDRYPQAGIELADLFASTTLDEQTTLVAGRLGQPQPPGEPRRPGPVDHAPAARDRRAVRRAFHREEGRR